MKGIIGIPIIIFSLIFELIGRVLAQVADICMGIAIMLLSTISNKKEE